MYYHLVNALLVGLLWATAYYYVFRKK